MEGGGRKTRRGGSGGVCGGVWSETAAQCNRCSFPRAAGVGAGG